MATHLEINGKIVSTSTHLKMVRQNLFHELFAITYRFWLLILQQHVSFLVYLEYRSLLVV